VRVRRGGEGEGEEGEEGAAVRLRGEGNV
jgi:hypothetical protein